MDTCGAFVYLFRRRGWNKYTHLNLLVVLLFASVASRLAFTGFPFTTAVYLLLISCELLTPGDDRSWKERTSPCVVQLVDG